MTSPFSRYRFSRYGLLLLAPAMVMSGAWADEPATDKAPANDSSARVGQGLGAVLGPKSTEGSGTTVDVGKGLRDVLRSGENRGESTTTSIGTGWGSVFGAGGSLSNTTPLAGKNLDDLLCPATTEGAAVSGVGLRVALILEQLRRGEKIDLDKALSEEELGYALAHNRELLKAKTPGVQVEASSLEAIRDQLVVLWLSRYSKNLIELEKGTQLIQSLPLSSRMLLGDYLSKRGDARCVAFYKACYLEWEKQNTDPITGQIRKVNNSIPGVHALAWFYQAKRKWRETAETYLLSEKYSTAPVWISSALVEAGRAYHHAGDEVKSQQTYAKIPQYGQGWYWGMAIYDQAETLIENGQYQKARDLIANGLESADKGVGVGESRAAINALVGYSYLREGDFARATLEAGRILQALENGNGRSTPARSGNGNGVQLASLSAGASTTPTPDQTQFEETRKAALEMTQQTLKYAEVWSQQKLMTEVPAVVLTKAKTILQPTMNSKVAANPSLTNPAELAAPMVWRGWVDILSPQRATLVANLEGLLPEAQVRTQALAAERAYDYHYYFSNRLKIEVTLPPAVTAASNLPRFIVVSSPQLSQTSLRVPLQLANEAK